MWQGALRNPDDPVRSQVVEAIETGQPITVELLYSDQVGRQRTISRFGLVPANDAWLSSLNRHWYLDWDGPRPESLVIAASDAVIRDHDAAADRRAAASEPAAEDAGEVGIEGDHSEADRDDPTVA